MPIKSVEDLRIYQQALDLLPAIYQMARGIEREDIGLARDIRKTARKIAPAITEGFAKRSSIPEFKRFLSIAK